MLQTYMKNKGTTKTIFHNNNTNMVKEYDWDIDYDGDKAKVSIDTKENGKPGHYELEFDNNDLANILKVNSVKKPINQRLLDDFNFNDFTNNNDFTNEPYIIKFDNISPPPQEPLLLQTVNNSEFQNPLEKMMHEFDEINENNIQKTPSIVIDIIKSKSKPKPRYKTRKRHKKFANYIPTPELNENMLNPIVYIKKQRTKKRPKVKIHRIFKIPKTQKIY
jgi:hypothetical protein